MGEALNEVGVCDVILNKTELMSEHERGRAHDIVKMIERELIGHFGKFHACLESRVEAGCFWYDIRYVLV